MTEEEMEKLSASDWLSRFEKCDSDWKNGAVDLELEGNPAQKKSAEKRTKKPENTDEYTVEDWAELMNGTQSGKADIFKD